MSRFFFKKLKYFFEGLFFFWLLFLENKGVGPRISDSRIGACES